MLQSYAKSSTKSQTPLLVMLNLELTSQVQPHV